MSCVNYPPTSMTSSIPSSPSISSVEVKCLQEFYEKIRAIKERSSDDPVHFCNRFIKLNQWNLEEIDFTSVDLSIWNALDFTGAVFWGCTFPLGVSAKHMREMGAVVEERPDDIPFNPYKAYMYSQEELALIDAETYNFYLQNHGMNALLSQTMHDYFIQDALNKYLEGKTAVVIMGGHGLKRSSVDYKQIVLLAWRLVRLGFVIATGGGPGAMEAANMGGYLFECDRSAVEDAVHVISTSGDLSCPQEFNNKAAARAVIEKYGPAGKARSIGIPTWRYGHEPSNIFASWHAKMFQNSIREDGLIAIGSGGIIYTPGSAGTRQEVFQAACKNHYAEKGLEVPMIFYGEEFWRNCSVFEVLEKNSIGRPFAQWLKLTNDIDEVVNICYGFSATHSLPLALSNRLRRYSEDLSKEKEQTTALSAAETATAAADHIVSPMDDMRATTATIYTSETPSPPPPPSTTTTSATTTASDPSSSLQNSKSTSVSNNRNPVGDAVHGAFNRLSTQLSRFKFPSTDKDKDRLKQTEKEGRVKLCKEKSQRFHFHYDDESLCDW